MVYSGNWAADGRTTFKSSVSSRVKKGKYGGKYSCCAAGQDLKTAVSVLQHRDGMENVNTTITSKRQQLPLSSLEMWTSPGRPVQEKTDDLFNCFDR